MMRIGVDLDEVLADFNTPFIEYCNKRFGKVLKREDFANSDYGPLLGKSGKEVIEIVNDFYKSIYFERMMPVSGSVNAVAFLSSMNDLFVVTSRPDFLASSTKKWICNNFGSNFLGIFHSSNHYTKRQNCGKSKVDLCRHFDLDLLIDDSLDYALQCSAAGVDSLLFGDYSWNGNGKLPRNIHRVKNWQEVLERLT